MNQVMLLINLQKLTTHTCKIMIQTKNQHTQTMSRNLPVSGFDQVEDTPKFCKDFVKGNNEDNDIKYFLEVDIKNLEQLHKLHNEIPFLTERIRVNKLQKTYMQFEWQEKIR